MKFIKMTTCPHCGGNLRSESIGWKCEKCQGFIDMQGNFHEYVEKPFMPPMTNADRIRSMTDEELAKWLLSPADLCGLCDNLDFCTGYPSHNDGRCIDAVIKYLRQTAEEAGHETKP